MMNFSAGTQTTAKTTNAQIAAAGKKAISAIFSFATRKRLRSSVVSLLLLLVSSLGSRVFGQASTANYGFANGNTGSLALDLNGNAVDLTTGSTSLVGAGTDDVASATTPISFDFWFMGVRYTTFTASDNGLIVLGGTVGTSAYGIPNSTNATIAPFANDMKTGTDGVVRSKVVGTAPNRCLIVEWSNNMIRYLLTAGPGTGTFQARLYESTGVIEYMYGTMNTNTATPTTYLVGFSVANSNNNVISVNTTTNLTSVTTATITNTYSASSSVTQLTSASNGSRINYKFTPPTPADPTGLSFTSVAASAMTLNWTDNASNDVGYLIYKSTDGITYNYLAQVAAVAGTGSTGSYTATGLSPSTTYYWKVYAVTEGRLSNALSGSQATSACGMSGSYTVGPTGTYTTIASAITALQANGTAGAVFLELQTTYAGETFPINIGVIPCAATNNITIRPLGTLTITDATAATSMFTLNGASGVIIDGRVGSTGTTKALTLSNTVTGGTNITFINDASGNTVKYCTLKSVETSTTNASILFSTTTGTTGNDNNTIDNCDILDGATFPIHGILSIGTSGKENDHNTISNCNIANFFSAGSNNTAGINLGTGSSDWTISNNKFYQTAARTYTSGFTHRAIYVNNSSTGNGFIITGNTIGYSSSTATGVYSMTGTVSTLFRAIEVIAGTTTPSSVQSNTVTAIYLAGSSSIFNGILTSSGSVNIGTTTGNVIGAASGTGSILLTNTGSNATAMIGINCSASGVVNISNNIVAALTATTTATGNGAGIVGISLSGTGTYSVSTNTIGSGTANSINAAQAVTSASQNAYGIQCSSSTPTALTISNNTISNIKNVGSGTSVLANGIFVSTAPTNALISGNNINNISSSSSVTSLTGQTGTAGIVFTAGSTTPTITQNTVNAISALNATSVQAHSAGIMMGSSNTNGVISRNKIYDINNASTMTTATTAPVAAGIIMGSATTGATIVNNMISLGNAQATNTAFSGILNTGTASTLKVYYNTVNIEGTVTSGALATACFNRGNYTTTAVTSTVDIQNNLFNNTRSGGTGTHFAIANGVNVPTSSNTGWSTTASNYNILNASVAANVGYWSGAKTFANWKAAPTTGSGGDANSQTAVAVTFSNSANGDLHINMGVTSNGIESHGVAITGFTTDFDNDTRPGPVGSVNGGASAPDVGADEFDGVPIDNLAPVMTYTTLTTACTTGDRTLAVTIVDASGIPAGGSGTEPRIYYKNGAGSYVSHPGTLTSGSLTNGVWTFTIQATDATPAIGNTISYFIIAQDNLGNVGSNPGTGLVATNVNTVATPPTTPNTYGIGITSGTYTVGTGQTFITLTSAVAAYNSSSCLSGPITFSLTDASYSGSETFPISINANALSSSTNTLTIKPAIGISPSITGSSSTGLIILNGADYVIIEGSNSPVTNTICPAATSSRNMTISNTNTSTTSAVVWIQTATGADAATNNIIRNCNITGSGNAQTLFGIGNGGTSVGYTSLGNGNSNNRIENNSITACTNGIYSSGTSSANKNQNNVISQNVMTAASPNNLTKNGIMVNFENSITISGNSIANINSGLSTDVVGINLGFGNNGISNTATTGSEVSNATVTQNTLDNIQQTNTWSTAGIAVAGPTTGTNTIANNMLSNVGGKPTSGDITAGILIGGNTGGTTRVYYNAVTITGTYTGGSDFTGAIAITGTNPVVDLKNNIFANTISNGSSLLYAIGLTYSTYTNLTSNNNDFYSVGTNLAVVNGLSAGTNQANLAAWQTTTGGDGASKNLNPTFTSSTNLHVSGVSTNLPLLDAGTPVSVTVDYDCATRNASTPDIGLNEFTLPPCVAPTNPPTGISFSSLSASGATVNFTNASPTPTGYIVVQSIGALLGTPAAGLTPTVGATCCTNGTIVAVGSGTPLVPVATLNPNTSYTESVFDYNNTSCLSGPAYNTTATSGILLTCPAAPTAIVNGAIDDASIAITWTAPTGGATSYTVLVYTNSGLSVPAVGYTVSYGAGTAATINGLSAVTQYWYTVTASNASCSGVASASQTGTTLDHPCSTTPSAGTASTSTGIASTATVITLSLTGATSAVGIAYQWESSPNGSIWTPISGATTATYNYSGITVNTYFHCVVTCTLVSLSATSTSAYVLYESCVPNAASWANGPVSTTFSPIGSTAQTWTVPAGVTTVAIDAQGAKGGGYNGFSTYGSNGGFGGRVQTTMNVTPAHVFTIAVAMPGPDGGGPAAYLGGGRDLTYSASYPGSGGGGYSSITDITSSTLLVVAGGGGGGGAYTSGSDLGGQGGGLIGGAGNYHSTVTLGTSGQGGTQSAGGTGSNPGSFLQGANNIASTGGGAGGGGYYGGGAGTANSLGGGGSSYTNSGFATAVVHTQGYNSSAAGGLVSFSYTLATESPMLGINTFSISASPGPNLVDVNMVASANSTTGLIDRTGLTPASLYNGSSYTASITWGTASAYQEAQVWIDFNDDGVYSTSEEVSGVVGYSATSTPNPTTFLITIPFGAATGNHLMRIRGIKESPTGTLALSSHLDPCLSQYGGTGPTADHGDVADYYVNIAPIPPCTGTPTAGTGAVSPSSGASSTSFTLSATGATVAGGINIQWQSSPDNSTWTNISGATTTPYTFTGISANTYYRANVTCSVTGLSAVTTNTVLATFVLPAPTCTPTAASWVNESGSYYYYYYEYGASAFTVTGYSGSTLDDENITSEINHTTGYASLTGSIPAVNLQQNSAYPTSIVWGVTALEQQAQVWVDFNDNGTFETSEEVTPVVGYNTSITPNPTNTNITIPMGARPGLHLMRMRSEWDRSSTTALASHLDPCLKQYLVTNPQYFSGTVTDYKANILCNTPAISGLLSACASGGTTSLSDAQPGGTWSSSNTSVATIGTGGVVTGLTGGTTTISYTFASTGCSATATLSVASAPLPISGSNIVCTGQTITLSDALLGGTWDNGGSANATVNASGVVTAVSAGTTIITYTACSNSVYLTVSTNLTPSISGTAPLCVSGTNTVTLTGTPSGGTWISGNPSIATVGSATGIVTAVTGGTVSISYTGTNGCITSASESINSIVPTITLNASPATICAGGTTTLTATTSAPKYAVTSIPYAPVAFTPTATFNSGTTPTAGFTYTNDESYYTVTLPINFTYFGTNYTAGTNVHISTNGEISFGTGLTSYYGAMPTATYPYDIISAVSHDLDMSAGGSITYGTTGVVPNRQFIVNFNAIPDFLASGNTETAQIVLDESTGNVDFHVTTLRASTHTIGVQQVSGVTAYTVPGQNNSTTAVSNTSYRFSPVTVAYTWSPSIFLGSTTSSSTVATAVTSTTVYTVTSAYGACSSSATVAASINPAPASISGGTSAICVGATTTVSDAVTGGTWSSSDPTIATIDLSANPATVTGVSGGTATITYFNVCGVSTTAVVTINAAVITGATNVCVSNNYIDRRSCRRYVDKQCSC